ncbi:sensor histidine kinase [Actinokineospora sp. UTMC 2448]|uniref:sensor histidine kinase n=1 Tax=Actinokineospora sp. UTMC 2448 TaxID=2268449 RepID=UPI002164AB72|nr:histidine kinase [Actinokineospora sp. UTMC 2448]UVS79225.1 Sensor histidine kinase DesK [Actinokineospora sp. UTMC 2448]
MRELLRSVWREPPPVLSTPRVWWDWALVAVLAPLAVVEAMTKSGLHHRGLSAVVVAGLVFTLLWRRSRPLLMVGIVFGVFTVVSVALGREVPDQDVAVFVLLLPFALFRWGSGRHAVLGAAIMLGKVGLSAVIGHLRPVEALGGVTVLLFAMALGAAVRYRASARARAVDQVRLVERERLARDLHDTVAHHVTAMAIRAQAGMATAATDPTAAVDALRLIDAEAARALDEMRGIVRILRAEQPDDLAPNPRVADLRRLVSHSGPVVAVELRGDVDDLPSPVAAAVYRLAQEAITNARRHARHATRVDVRVVADHAEVRVLVSDDGEAGHLSGAPGYGLIGMRERANLLGGTCAAGPDPDGGWTVTAVLPRAGARA